MEVVITRNSRASFLQVGAATLEIDANFLTISVQIKVVEAVINLPSAFPLGGNLPIHLILGEISRHANSLPVVVAETAIRVNSRTRYLAGEELRPDLEVVRRLEGVASCNQHVSGLPRRHLAHQAILSEGRGVKIVQL